MNKQLLDELDSYYNNYITNDSNCSLIQSDDDDDVNILNFTYGTTPFETFKKVIDEVKKPKRFVVLGSSIGWQCFFWNSLFPDIPVVGVEIHQFRFEFSCYLAEKYKIQNISFINDDIRNMDFDNGDLIWENNVCFSDISDEVNWRVLTRYEDIQIVSYSSILFEHQSNSKILLIDHKGNFKGFTQRKLELPVSWSEKQTFNII